MKVSFSMGCLVYEGFGLRGFYNLPDRGVLAQAT